MFEKILDFIYPQKCGFCNKIIIEDYACKSCKKNLEYICIENKLEKFDNKNFDYSIFAYKYEGIVRQKILEFKFKNKKYLYKTLSGYLAEIIEMYSYLFDYIISVPISLNRYFERGYNQSYLIAKYVSKKIKKQILKFVLIKTKNNKKQSALGIFERKQNVKNVYKVINKNKIQNKRILLIDDIYTTGATVEECAKVLRENGAKSVIVAVIAKA